MVAPQGLVKQAASEAVLAYIGDSKYKQFVRSNVKRALRAGLWDVVVSVAGL